MFNAKNNLRIHNKFELVLKDGATGAIKQTAYAENVVTNAFYNLIFDNNNAYLWNPFRGIVMGTGSGTPAASDTTLFSRAFSLQCDTLVDRRLALPTSYMTKSVTFPATSAYVGNLTEVGFYYTHRNNQSNNSLVSTHAMLKDSEGNPITITKTALDTLIVTGTVYLTLTNSAEGFYLWPAAGNLMLDRILLRQLGFDTSSSNYNSPFRATALALFVSCRPVSNDPVLTVTTPLRPGETKTFDATNKIFAANGTRVPTGSGNTKYYHGVGLEGIGHMQLPNPNIFPNKTITGIQVGVGDGSKSKFSLPLPLFVDGTEKVYKNGSRLARGVDYTIINNSNPDMLCNISPGNFSVYSLYTGNRPAGGTVSNDLYIPFHCDSPRTPVDSSLDPHDYPCFDDSNPLVLTLNYTDPTIGRKCNCLVIDGLSTFGRPAAFSTNATGIKIYLDYSNDGSSWTTAGSETCNTAAFKVTINFSTVTAKWWRIRIDTSGALDSYSGNPTGWKRYPIIFNKLNGSFLGYTTQNGLSLSSAPGVGDVITMDCDIDRPYKSENYVLDASFSLQLA